MSDVMFGFGAMRLDLEDGNDESSINFKDFAEMIDYYMDQGFNYFDTSFAYHEGQSEIGLREGLVKRYPRESFKIADKMPTWLLQSEEDNEKYMNIMLERLGVDYFDVFLIHNINPAFYQIAEKCKLLAVFMGRILWRTWGTTEPRSTPLCPWGGNSFCS